MGLPLCGKINDECFQEGKKFSTHVFTCMKK